MTSCTSHLIQLTFPGKGTLKGVVLLIVYNSRITHNLCQDSQNARNLVS